MRSLIFNFLPSKLICFFKDVLVCETNGGDDANQQCVFPFSYEGVTYEDCTSVGNNGTDWCSTEVDENGEYVSGKWGNCGSGCIKDNDALLLGNKKYFCLTTNL